MSTGRREGKKIIVLFFLPAFPSSCSNLAYPPLERAEGRGGGRGRAPVAGWRELCRLPNMLGRITKLTSTMGLALCLGLTFTPLGCGGSQGMGMESSHGAGE